MLSSGASGGRESRCGWSRIDASWSASSPSDHPARITGGESGAVAAKGLFGLHRSARRRPPRQDPVVEPRITNLADSANLTHSVVYSCVAIPTMNEPLLRFTRQPPDTRSFFGVAPFASLLVHKRSPWPSSSRHEAQRVTPCAGVFVAHANCCRDIGLDIVRAYCRASPRRASGWRAKCCRGQHIAVLVCP